MKSTFECLRPSSVNICTIITIIIIIKTPRKELELLQYTTTEIRGNVLLSSNVSLESSEKIAQEVFYTLRKDGTVSIYVWA